MRYVLNTMGEIMTDADVNDMIREADKNGDGVVDYEEFLLLVSWLD